MHQFLHLLIPIVRGFLTPLLCGITKPFKSNLFLNSYLVALSLQEEQDETTRGPQTHVYPGGPDVPQPLTNQTPTQQSAQTNQEWSE